MRRCGLLCAVGALAAVSLPRAATAQSLPPDVVATLKDVVGSRIETVVILAGDRGISGGTLSQTDAGTYRRNVTAKVTKFGGAGDVGHPQPLGGLPIRWQPRLQASIGYLTAKNDFQAGMLQGDESDDKSFAVELGGGARLWFTDRFSFAPRVVGLYGHIENDYTPRSAFAQENLQAARDLGLIDWTADTWTIIPAADARYRVTWRGAVFSASSDFMYYYTRSFRTSNPNLTISGSSEAWKNQIDADVPLGLELFGHELHTGGFFNRTEFYGDLRTGLETDHMYKAHARLVLDFLGTLWKVKWIGAGGSYLWGSNFHAWGVAVDVALQL